MDDDLGIQHISAATGFIDTVIHQDIGRQVAETGADLGPAILGCRIDTENKVHRAALVVLARHFTIAVDVAT